MGYLINCEYFNNLNRDGDMVGIPHTHTYTQSMRGFPVKTETGSGNTHGNEFICHL